jgi:hypothetical protein
VITPVAGPAPSPTACEGAMIYTFTYTIVQVTRTYGIIRTRSTYLILYLPADGASTVNCPADATAPTPPVSN